MRNAIAAILLLFSTSAMAGTFTSYTPPVHIAPMVHIAPVVHVAPMVHVNPVVHVNPMVRTVPTGGRVHFHPRILPVAVNGATQTPKKCVDQKSGAKECRTK
jgi:hypothetical protein